jgi:hypothetical protein
MSFFVVSLNFFDMMGRVVRYLAFFFKSRYDVLDLDCLVYRRKTETFYKHTELHTD